MTRSLATEKFQILIGNSICEWKLDKKHGRIYIPSKSMKKLLLIPMKDIIIYLIH